MALAVGQGQRLAAEQRTPSLEAGEAVPDQQGLGLVLERARDALSLRRHGCLS
jgi:hypothetical protein